MCIVTFSACGFVYYGFSFIYPHTLEQEYGAKPDEAFAQLLSYLGMRSSIDKRANVRTLAFDPDGWNRTGYRLIKGGDVKGGKPTIAYRSNAARNLHNATSRIA